MLAALLTLLITQSSKPIYGPPVPKIEFLRDVAPILDRYGCSSAQCHGKFGGRGGFQLSLLTLSPEDDFEPIVYGGLGRRVNLAAPERSLLLLKATGAVPHTGGRRFAPGSRPYNTIARWIAAGAPFDDSDPRLASLTLQPFATTIARAGMKGQVHAIATYTDGSRRDVTDQAVFESTNPAVCSVDSGGSVSALRWGGGAIISRYLGTVAATFVTIPQIRTVTDPRTKKLIPASYPAVPETNAVDRLVFANLKRLNVLPSELSSDSDFLRRVTLDTLGRLPTTEEIQAFLADTAPDKRPKLIDKVLDQPEFADFRTLRLCDLLRVNPRKISNIGGSLGDRSAALFYEWIWKSVRANKPWDQFVREIITAKGSIYQNGPAAFYRIERAPNDRMENLGQAFLGVRMSCARCHKHPFDRWTTDDYWNFAAFMGKVNTRGGRLEDESIIGYNARGQIRNQSVVGRNRGKVAPCTFLGEKEPAPDQADMITELADWVTSPKNPFFARATVNRLWSYYFGRGIVSPVDDMRATTPESVPGLLDALAGELVSSGWDTKKLIKLILNSRTYQLTSVPNETNRLDDRFFSRCFPRPMPAQALLDIINQAAGSEESFGSFPERSRAVQASIPIRNQFLNAFGESHREFLADLDPKLEPTLTQTLMMINSPYVESKVRNGKAVGEVLKTTQTDDEMIRQLYLRTLSREPSAKELARARTILSSPPTPPAGQNPATGTLPAPTQQKPPDRKESAQDLLWALVTAREFYFNH